MNDQHIIAIAAMVQDALLVLNLVLIAWYLWETHNLRKTAQDQVTKSQDQVAATIEQTKAIRRQVAIAQDQPSG